jgi:hypothetical protein
MRKNQLSSLILTGQLTREEALKILENPPINDDDIDNEFRYIANKLSISVDELNHYFKMPKKFYWDYKNQKKLFDFGEKILQKIAGTRRGGAY